MKYIKSLLCIVLIMLMLSGCTFRLASSVNDLVSPVSPLGENADILHALDAYVSNGYSLKNPVHGKNITSFSFFDIDNDKVDEAIAFYEPKDNLGEIEMAIIKKVDSSWSVVENILGKGKAVFSVDFKDVNGDKKTEIVVCWDIINNSTNHEFSVYKIKNDKNKIKLSLIDEPITINEYIFVDYDGDGLDEALLFELTSGNFTSAKAELYSLKNNHFKLLGETKLDSHITSYTTLQIEEAENDIRVYADAVGSDGASMLTEVIYWSNSYDTIISPFYSYSTGRTYDTGRSAMIPSTDVDDDGLLEIPTDKKKKTPKQVSAVNWKCYKNTTLIHKCYSLLVDTDNYFVTIPDKHFNKIKVSYDEKSKEMSVLNKSSKNLVFSIKPMLKATYDSNKDSDYSVVMENSGYYYLAKLGNDKDIKITIDEIKQFIKSC